MRVKELISKVSTNTGIPAAQVRRVTNEVLDVLRANVETGETFFSSHLNIRIVTLKPSGSSDKSGQVVNAVRRVGRLVPKKPKDRKLTGLVDRS